MANELVKPIFEQVQSDISLWTIISGSTAIPASVSAEENYAYTYPELSKVKGVRSFNMEDTIKNFSLLEPNWDSYNADKVADTSIETALFVLNFLKREDMFSKGIDIHVFPMRDGGIQFEFDSENSACELEINPQGEMMFIAYDEDDTIWETTPIYPYELSELKEQIEEAVYAE